MKEHRKNESHQLLVPWKFRCLRRLDYVETNLAPVIMTKMALLQLILGIFCIPTYMAGCSKAPVQERPEDAAALVSRGLLRAEQGDERAAIADYTVALRVEHERPSKTKR